MSEGIKCFALAALFALAATLASAQQSSPTPTGAVQSVQNFATGTTAVVTATLAGQVGKTIFVCGFNASFAGTGSISPITVTGLLNGTLTVQGVGATAPQAPLLNIPFSPCLPASGPNTSIAVSSTANASATAVDVNIWGFAQ